MIQPNPIGFEETRSGLCRLKKIATRERLHFESTLKPQWLIFTLGSLPFSSSSRLTRPPPHCEGTRRADLAADNTNEDIDDLRGVELRRHCEVVMIEEEEEEVLCSKKTHSRKRHNPTEREGYICWGLRFLLILKLLEAFLRA